MKKKCKTRKPAKRRKPRKDAAAHDQRDVRVVHEYRVSDAALLEEGLY